MRYISVQMCGILLLGAVTFLGGRRKTLHTRDGHAFKTATVAIAACLVLDIASVIAIMAASPEFPLITEMICRIYLSAILASGLSIFRYMMADQRWNGRHVKRLWIFAGVIITAGVFTILAGDLNAAYRDNIGQLYTEGTAVMGAFAGMAALMVLSFAATFILYPTMNRRKIWCIRVWTGLILISGVIQLINRELLIVGFAMSLGILFVFEKAETPMRYLDQETGLFNALAFKAYIAEEYALGRHPLFLRLTVNSRHKDMSADEASRVVRLFSTAISTCHGTAFRTSSYSFAIVSNDKEDIEKAEYSLTDFIRVADANLVISGLRNTIYIMTDPALFGTPEEMENLYFRLRSYRIDRDDPAYTVTVGRKVINRIYADEKARETISSALENNRVEVFYQPIYDTRTGLFSSAEALVRIREEDGSIIPPGEIIPVAEDSGLIVPLGERVFSIVCNLLGSDRKPEGLRYIEVNLSAVQCRHEALYGNFKAIMDRTGVGPGQINLEITETARLSTTQKIIDVFDRFKEDGVGFSLDDFGTGNSNLDYVANMPMVSIVKIDHAMTSGYFTSPRIQMVFPHIVAMVKAMGLEIVCEGIETGEQLEVMKDFGIEYIQGYYFSRPLPETEFLRFMSEHSGTVRKGGDMS